MIADLIAAHPDDADIILATPGHANVWPTLESSTIDPLRLAELGLIVQGLPSGNAAVADLAASFPTLVSTGAEGPSIVQLPDTLVGALAELDAAQLAPIAARLAAAPGARRDGLGTVQAEALLAELSAFAATALTQGQTLLLWLCP